MRTMSSEEAAARFQPLRPRLIRVAYRMLGSVSDAEDIVQEAFLRWLDVDHAAVQEPEAYLRRGHAPAFGPAEIGAPSTRNLRRPLAAGTSPGCSGGRYGRHYAAADARFGT